MMEKEVLQAMRRVMVVKRQRQRLRPRKARLEEAFRRMQITGL